MGLVSTAPIRQTQGSGRDDPGKKERKGIKWKVEQGQSARERRRPTEAQVRGRVTTPIGVESDYEGGVARSSVRGGGSREARGGSQTTGTEEMLMMEVGRGLRMDGRTRNGMGYGALPAWKIRKVGETHTAFLQGALLTVLEVGGEQRRIQAEWKRTTLSLTLVDQAKRSMRRRRERRRERGEKERERERKRENGKGILECGTEGIIGMGMSEWRTQGKGPDTPRGPVVQLAQLMQVKWNVNNTSDIEKGGTWTGPLPDSKLFFPAFSLSHGLPGLPPPISTSPQDDPLGVTNNDNAWCHRGDQRRDLGMGKRVRVVGRITGLSQGYPAHGLGRRGWDMQRPQSSNQAILFAITSP
ncbi:hypothetical protein BJ684DRAFT_14546 [Piptocephalis cylindrospora]|uniref:Uncharacterized protein n=1 Tax=Piptocephalis cylindrospora TaxID=1907219 RepID=A0A4P9Y7Z4_9FUNG|nr:hypothetical protein BJ684DRAFT_14546 [Piptocephalis cylindrospora]|eukprot:RKP15183.1 hypothetical protein BJ684DRAFT_14546 [Piptocephalis cylindrospora]